MKIRITFDLNALCRRAIANHYGLDKATYDDCRQHIETVLDGDLETLIADLGPVDASGLPIPSPREAARAAEQDAQHQDRDPGCLACGRPYNGDFCDDDCESEWRHRGCENCEYSEVNVIDEPCASCSADGSVVNPYDKWVLASRCPDCEGDKNTPCRRCEGRWKGGGGR